MSEADDKRELLRLKQGLITESETIKEEKYVIPELRGRKKFENFFYHYKVRLILITFISITAIFLIVDIFSKQTADLKVIICVNDYDGYLSVSNKSSAVEAALGELCEDYDGNGYIYADIDLLNLVQNDYADPNYYIANSTRLFGEMQSESGQLLIGNLDVFLNLLGSQDPDMTFLVDLSLLYPRDENVYEKYFYKVKGSLLAETANWTDCPDDLYFAVRKASEYGSEKDRTKNLEMQSRTLNLLEKIMFKKG